MPTGLSEAEKGKLTMLSTRPRTGEEKQRSLSNRATGRVKAWGPPGWIEKSNIAYERLRIRDRATELKRERDVLWNRVHASQLALL